MIAIAMRFSVRGFGCALFCFGGTRDEKSGSSFSVGCHTSEHHSERIGDGITLSPLVTYDVELYLRCAKAVAEQTDKPLVFSISTNLPGYDQIAVKVR